MPAWRLAVAAAALVAYAGLSHWLMLHAAQQPWAVAALCGPLLLAVAAVGWQRRQPLTLLGGAAVVLLLALVVARGGVADIRREAQRDDRDVPDRVTRLDLVAGGPTDGIVERSAS